MVQALRILRERNDVLALVVILLSIQFFEGGVPPGIRALGVVGGATIALHAIGVVLVYRANRIINFAQVQIGVVAATFFVVMVQYMPLFRLVRAVCPPCIERVTPGLYRFNYYFSLILSFVLALVLAYAIYVFVVKRFSNAPRLVLTVATIFLAQLLGGFQGMIPNQLTTEEQQEAGLQLGAVGAPFDWQVEISPATFHTPDILTVLIGLLFIGGLMLYFRRSSTGIAIRAAAENPSRVATLGVNVDKVTSRVWIAAGALSATAGLLTAMSVGAQGESSLNVSTMVKILAVAVIARMVSLPMTAAAAVVFGVLEQSVLWSFGSTVALDGVFLLILATVLLLQRYQASRAEIEQASAWKADREIRPIPKELAHLAVVKRWVRNGWAVLVVVALGLPWVLSPSQTNLMAVYMIYGMIGLSLLVLTGWAGQISLGQFAFAAVGGYVAAYLGWPWPLAIVAAALAGAVVAVLIGLPALKLRGLHLAIMTLAFALSTSAILLNPRFLGKHLPDSLERPTLLGMEMEDQRVFYYFTMFFLVAVVAAIVGLRRSRTARALIASRDNEQAAQSFGINLVRARLGAFAISGFVAALAGALFAYSQFGVQATAYPPEQSVTMFLIAVIGGFGAVAGPLLGTTYFAALTLFTSNPIVIFIASGGGGLIVLMLIPGGLSSLVFGLRDSLLRRVAKRYRILVPSLVADQKAEVLLSERAAIAPKMRPGGGAVFVPSRYRLEDQWALGLTGETVLHANLHRDGTEERKEAEAEQEEQRTFGPSSSTETESV